MRWMNASEVFQQFLGLKPRGELGKMMPGCNPEKSKWPGCITKEPGKYGLASVSWAHAGTKPGCLGSNPSSTTYKLCGDEEAA